MWFFLFSFGCLFYPSSYTSMAVLFILGRRNTTDIGSTTAHLLTKWKHRKRKEIKEKSFFSSLIISSSYTALHNPFLSFFILFSHKSRPIPRRSNVCIFVFQFKRFSLLCVVVLCGSIEQTLFRGLCCMIVSSCQENVQSFPEKMDKL